MTQIIFSYEDHMDTKTRYLTEVDVTLARVPTSRASCASLKRRLVRVTKRYDPSEILEPTRRVWDALSCDENDDVSLERICQHVAGIKCRGGVITDEPVLDPIPHGYVIPRIRKPRSSESSLRAAGWMHHPVHGWVAPVRGRRSGEQNRRRRVPGSMNTSIRGSFTQSIRNKVLFCVCILLLIGVLFYKKRQRMGRVISSFQSLDQEFMHAAPPTHLRIETQTMLPSTTDLVRDFRQIAGTSLASSRGGSYS